MAVFLLALGLFLAFILIAVLDAKIKALDRRMDYLTSSLIEGEEQATSGDGQPLTQIRKDAQRVQVLAREYAEAKTSRRAYELSREMATLAKRMEATSRENSR